MQEKKNTVIGPGNESRNRKQRTGNDPLSVFWFRRDLRLSDNCGLYHALQSGHPVIPIFIFDKDILDPLPAHDARVSFIHRALQDIKRYLRVKNSDLLVRHGHPDEVFVKLCRDYNIKAVYTNRDYEPYATSRDARIARILREEGAVLHTFKDQVIFEKDEIRTRNGKPFTVYTPYRNAWQSQLQSGDFAPFPSENLTENFLRFRAPDLPGLSEIGFEPVSLDTPSPDPSDEILSLYDRDRDYPARNGTSRLGVHLRFGTVSIRHLVRKAMELSDTWLGELIWRDFFMMILANFPHVVDRPFDRRFDKIEWRDDPGAFERWCNGTTGYPIVDAGMRELNETGYMHNRVRMVAAGFLAKHLLIDWRLGERYFAGKLLDYDLAANNGNWQWAAGCGCDAAPYFRIFNPQLQAEKFDPENRYIKKWVPEFGTPLYPKPIIDHKTARERALAVYGDAVKKTK
jgi:deoxyribodipyrimidine photo-lyase